MTKITLVTAIVVAVLMLFSRFGRAGTQDETAAVDKDAQVLAQLRAAGSNVEKPHQLEFFFYLPTQEKAAAIATVLGQQGFTTRVERAAQGPGWLSFATKLMVPTHAALVRLRQEFESLGAKHGGEYDGWGTEVVK
jgi:hypothetical protein